MGFVSSLSSWRSIGRCEYGSCTWASGVFFISGVKSFFIELPTSSLRIVGLFLLRGFILRFFFFLFFFALHNANVQKTYENFKKTYILIRPMSKGLETPLQLPVSSTTTWAWPQLQVWHQPCLRRAFKQILLWMSSPSPLPLQRHNPVSCDPFGAVSNQASSRLH